MKSILLIEDDPAISLGLKTILEEEFRLQFAEDGINGLSKAIEFKPDLVILDLMLPGKDGFEICKEIRKANINSLILILSSKKEEIDKVMAFEIGADDYVTKPFSLMELRMRVKALLRRNTILAIESHDLVFGDITLKPKNMDAYKNGKPLCLSAKEFNILMYLFERDGQVVPRSELLDMIWGYESMPTTRTVDNYILSIRKKIETKLSQPKHLVTVHTIGYKLIK